MATAHHFDAPTRKTIFSEEQLNFWGAEGAPIAIVFSFRLLYGFMFVTRVYIYRAIKMAALEGTVLERLKSSLLLFLRL